MDVDNELLKIEFLFHVPKTYPLLPVVRRPEKLKHPRLREIRKGKSAAGVWKGSLAGGVSKSGRHGALIFESTKCVIKDSMPQRNDIPGKSTCLAGHLFRKMISSHRLTNRKLEETGGVGAQKSQKTLQLGADSSRFFTVLFFFFFPLGLNLDLWPNCFSPGF